MQVKLEEQEEKSNTLGQVNSVLRDQLDKAGQNNAALVGDLKRLANDWDKLNRELIDRVRKKKRLANGHKSSLLELQVQAFVSHETIEWDLKILKIITTKRRVPWMALLNNYSP